LQKIIELGVELRHIGVEALVLRCGRAQVHSHILQCNFHPNSKKIISSFEHIYTDNNVADLDQKLNELVGFRGWNNLSGSSQTFQS
jgi:hypothetical protein